MVFPWELRQLQTIADQRNKTIEFFPVIVFPESISKKNIVFAYAITNPPCVFYENNACTIYDQRPLVCVSYPLSYNYDKNRAEFSSDCPAVKLFMEQLNNNKNVDYFRAAQMMDGFRIHFHNLFKKYEEEDRIKLIGEKHNWNYVDIDNFFRELGEEFYPYTFHEAKKAVQKRMDDQSK